MIADSALILGTYVLLELLGKLAPNGTKAPWYGALVVLGIGLVGLCTLDIALQAFRITL